ncbi:MAG: S-layer protein domain-containing protein, partial [Methanosarcinaceae archaeon]|nr:S-layer protein domain-containing protein [Methanosarcinaceae archaeon]
SSHGPLGIGNSGNNVIDDEELVYTTVPYPTKQKIASKLGLNAATLPEDVKDPFYHTLAWFGTPYIAIENDSTQIAPLVFKQGGSDEKCLKTGEVWNIGKGYNLSVQQVDVEGDKVWFSLEKDGKELESAIVNAAGPVADRIFAGTADIGNSDDQLYFITYVDSVFQGQVDSLAVFKYTWLVDKDSVLVIENNDEFNGFEVKEANKDRLVLKNKDMITIKMDDKTYFTDKWYFQASDKNKSRYGDGYVIYPGTDVVVEAPEDEIEAEAQADESTGKVEAPVNLQPKNSDSAEKETASKAISRATDSPGSETSSEEDAEENNAGEKEAPGFGLLAGVLGLAAGFVRRK